MISILCFVAVPEFPEFDLHVHPTVRKFLLLNIFSHQKLNIAVTNVSMEHKCGSSVPIIGTRAFIQNNMRVETSIFLSYRSILPTELWDVVGVQKLRRMCINPSALFHCNFSELFTKKCDLQYLIMSTSNACQEINNVWFQYRDVSVQILLY